MRIALVTGANRGLGLATARRLAADGDHVVIAARSAEAGASAAAELSREGLAASSVTLDVTDADSVRDAAAEVADRFGRLDILVNNAGILPEATNPAPAEVVDAAMFAQTYATNVLGPVTVTEAFLPLLRRSEAGRIVNVSSTVGSLAHQTDPDSPWHAMLAKALADTPITVTSVCPGWVQTDLAPGNREQAPVPPAEAAEVVARAVNLGPDAPSGTFIDAKGPVDW